MRELRPRALNFREFIEFLMAYLEGEIPHDERALFEAHLAICPECRNYLATYKATVRLAKSAPSATAEEIPEDVPERLVTAILAARDRS